MNRRLAVAVALVAGVGLASIAVAQAAPAGQQRGGNTPKSWNYQLDKSGHRVAKGDRVTNADGSWREEVRHGKCSTVKEMTAKGEYKETHSCD
jgi:hypothetical protein